MKKQSVVLAGVVGLTLLISSVNSATAQNRTFKEALEECFWGLILPNEDQRGLSLGLNVVSGALGSYAYTSATLSPDTFCAEKTQRTAIFVKESYQRLAEDIARGNGEFLLTAMELTSCTTAQAQSAVSNDLRRGLLNDVSHPNFASSALNEKAVRLFTELELSANTHCTV